MNAATATISARAAQPDLTRAWARASATLNALAALTLVSTLIAYGKAFSLMFRAHAAELTRSLAGRLFGTSRIHIARTRALRGVMGGVTLFKVQGLHAGHGPNSLPAAQPGDHPTPGHSNPHARPDAAETDAAPANAVRPMCRRISADQGTADAACPRAAAAFLRNVCPDVVINADYTSALRHALLLPIDRPRCSFESFTADVVRCKAPASRVETPCFEAPPDHHRPGCLLEQKRSCDHAPPHTASAERSSPRSESCSAPVETFVQTETAPATPARISPSSAPPPRGGVAVKAPAHDPIP